MGFKNIIKRKKKKGQLPEVQETKYKGLTCLNCGHPLRLTDRFCSNCSQKNSTKQLSIIDFFNEFLSSIFTYDSRLRYTLKDLLFKPGVITKNYVAGQRLKYANPFRFYLSVAIIYFILQGFSTPTDLHDIKINGDFSNDEESFSENTDKISNENTTYFNANSLNKEIDSIVKASTATIPKEEKTPVYLSEAVLDTLSFSKRTIERAGLYRDFYNNTKIKNPTKALDSLKHSKTKFNIWLYSKNETIERVTENPSSFINYLTMKIPFFLFFFAPFFAFFFWIFYSKKKYNYMEHLIFIFHIFSFVFLAGIIAYFPDLLLGDNAFFSTIIFLFIGPFYFYKALRNFYKQDRVLTVFKFFALNVIFFIGSLIAATLFFTASAVVY